MFENFLFKAALNYYIINALTFLDFKCDFFLLQVWMKCEHYCYHKKLVLIFGKIACVCVLYYNCRLVDIKRNHVVELKLVSHVHHMYNTSITSHITSGIFCREVFVLSFYRKMYDLGERHMIMRGAPNLI